MTNTRIKIDGRQIVTNYLSGAGVEVYEIQQYNKEYDSWFIVGNCSTSLDYIDYAVYNHNLKEVTA